MRFLDVFESTEAADRRRCVWSKVVVVVKAPPRDVLAHIWANEQLPSVSSRSSRVSLLTAGAFSSLTTLGRTRAELERRVVERPNAHNMVSFVQKRFAGRVREFVGRHVWQAVGPSYVVVTVPTEHPACPRKGLFVRAELRELFKLEAAGGHTELTYVCQLDMGGHVPAQRAQPCRAAAIRDHFQGLVPLSALSADDGRAMGDALARTRGPAKLRVRSCMRAFAALEEMAEDHPWLEGLLAEIVRNKLRVAAGAGQTQRLFGECKQGVPSKNRNTAFCLQKHIKLCSSRGKHVLFCFPCFCFKQKHCFCPP